MDTAFNFKSENKAAKTKLIAPITISIFDLFKIGPGPSSSHTIGPMLAARYFRQALLEEEGLLEQGDKVRVFLYGSLSATGMGHGTDRAILAGLLDWQPEDCDPERFNALWKKQHEYCLSLPGKEVLFSKEDLIFGPVEHDYAYSNTMLFQWSRGEEILFERIFFSVGGGFVTWPEKLEEEAIAAQMPSVPYPYTSMAQIKKILEKEKLVLHRLVMLNEMSISGLSEDEINARLRRMINVMEDAVNRGLKTRGILPGEIGLARKAADIYRAAMSFPDTPGQFLKCLCAYCLAAAEENAAGNLVVTAPTSGSSGVIPGIVHMLKHHFDYDDETLAKGLMAAAAIGNLVKHNASISGAEVGCMGEIGTASAMGAALFAYVFVLDVRVVEIAAEIALEHHLGLTCDPVGGYVQIPCIERNAMGGAKSYIAYFLASSGMPESHKISLDRVIRAVAETGQDMSNKYKETSMGGLALGISEC